MARKKPPEISGLPTRIPPSISRKAESKKCVRKADIDMSKINTLWINFSSITKRWVRDLEDVIFHLKIHPLELVVLAGSFVGVLGCLTLVVTNRADLLVIWASEVYEALPKVFK